MGVTASELFAKAAGVPQSGNFRCHWCGKPCGDKHPHGVRPQVIGQRRDPTIAVPSSPYQCLGCVFWRVPSRTVAFLTGNDIKDRQAAKNHSWYITDKGAWGLRRQDSAEVFARLLLPPIPFCLALLDREQDPKADNQLHRAIVNDPLEIRGETELSFTVNNLPYTYSVHELEVALGLRDATGMSVGVRYLLQLFDASAVPSRKEKTEDRRVGRPSEPILTPVKTTQKKIASEKPLPPEKKGR